MCIRHVFASVLATRVALTDYGTYLLCDECAATMRAGGYVWTERAIAESAGDLMCQCEHSDHFDAALDAQAIR